MNREDIDFSSVADSKSYAQEISLAEDTNGSIEYPVKAVKFQNVSSITFYFPKTAGGDDTQMAITYLGLKGEATHNKRAAVTFVYESAPQAQDHKSGAHNANTKTIH